MRIKNNNMFMPPAENGKWLNIKTGKTTTGYWEYLRGSDRFRVKLKGKPIKIIDGDTPEYGYWELQRD